MPRDGIEGGSVVVAREGVVERMLRGLRRVVRVVRMAWESRAAEGFVGVDRLEMVCNWEEIVVASVAVDRVLFQTSGILALSLDRSVLRAVSCCNNHSFP